LALEWKITTRGLQIAAWSAAALALIAPAARLGTTPYPNTPIYDYRPPLVRSLDETAATVPLHYGYAGYWQARLITLLSKSDLRAYAVDGDLNPLLWANNEQWYSQSTHIDFVVLDDPSGKLHPTRQ
jgi:hypothetical protein